MKIYSVIFSLFLIPLRLFSAENIKIEVLTTKNGEIYKSVTVRTITPANIRIFHSTGAAVIPFEELPEEIQERLGGFDADKAKGFRKDAKEKEKKMNNYLAAQEKKAREAAGKRIKQTEKEKAKGEKRWIVGKVLRIRENSVLLLPPSDQNRTRTYRNTRAEPTSGAISRFSRERGNLPRELRSYLSKGGTFFGSELGKKFIAQNWIKTADDYGKVFPLEKIFNHFQVMDTLSPFKMISQDKPIVVKTDRAIEVADGDFVSLWVDSEDLYKTPDGRTLRSFKIATK